jgi:hypothetical protein
LFHEARAAVRRGEDGSGWFLSPIGKVLKSKDVVESVANRVVGYS